MDSDGLPIVGPGIDLTKVTAINQKRTLAFLNHYITHTVRFLNRFSCVCEEKLANLSTKIQRLETTMNILEAKLSSIPGLENVTVSTSASSTTTSQPSKPQEQIAEAESPPNSQTNEDIKFEEKKTETQSNPVSKDPRYAHYFKMLKLGVPEMAVKQKMAADGLNPDLLSDPDAPAPADTEKTSQNEDSDTDFSGDEQENMSADSSSSAFSD